MSEAGERNLLRIPRIERKRFSTEEGSRKREFVAKKNEVE